MSANDPERSLPLARDAAHQQHLDVLASDLADRGDD
jgi:hypothetical protein